MMLSSIHTDRLGPTTKAIGGESRTRSSGPRELLPSMSALMDYPLSVWSPLSARTKLKAEDHQFSPWRTHSVAPSELLSNQIYLNNQSLRPTLLMNLVRLLKLDMNNKPMKFQFLMEQKPWQLFAVNAVALTRNKNNFSCSARDVTHTPLSTILA